MAAFKLPGGGEGSRTLDLSIANAALSQLSYAPGMCLLYEPEAKVVKRTSAMPFASLQSIQVAFHCPIHNNDCR